MDGNDIYVMIALSYSFDTISVLRIWIVTSLSLIAQPIQACNWVWPGAIALLSLNFHRCLGKWPGLSGLSWKQRVPLAVIWSFVSKGMMFGKKQQAGIIL